MNLISRLFKTAPPPEAKPAPKPKSIYDLARAVSGRFDEVAHPAELRTCDEFARAVRDLAALSHPNDRLLTYALGENATIASLALSVLATSNAVECVDRILESLNSFEGRWTKFFALDALDGLVPPPAALLGRVLVAMNEDWSDGYDRFLTQFARDFASRRAAAGEPLTFGDALARAGGDRLDDVDALLKKLGPAIAAPLQGELASHRGRHANVDYLRTIGKVWGEEKTDLVPHPLLDDAADVIERSLTGERRRSVVVTGDEGTGKSTAIRAAARRLQAAGWTIFEAGATEILAGQSYIGQLEARLRKIVKNLRDRRIAWLIPNLHELQFAGAYKENPTAVLDLLLPEIEAGEIVVIGEVTAHAYARLVERKRAVRTAFAQVRIEAMTEDGTLQLAGEWLRRRGLRVDDAVLNEASQLTTQFLGNRAAPGNLLGLLELAVEHAEDGTVRADDLVTALAHRTGLPAGMFDEREGLDPRTLREHFAARVLGQPEAVEVLVERVAMLKAGLTDPRRPLGVFLFAGPTGTGKTEIAKALAAYLFGSPERMIRIDMSELQTADSLARLVGESDGSVVSLADEVRRQPFSVLLLDEVEKAHRNVLDLFLQVFDDGRLTDRRGNTADFRYTIVILTSNLGSAIRTNGRAGFAETAGAGFSAATVTKTIERELRRELVNRFDRVVVFRPLTRETMRGIVRKELNEACLRRGLRNREWTVRWEESALEFLLDAGFTADLGARPLKRAVEQHFLTPLAERIVSRRVPAGRQMLRVRGGEKRLVFEFEDGQANAVDAAPDARKPRVRRARRRRSAASHRR